MQQDARELLRRLVDVDRRAAVFGACQCARTVLHLAPDGEHRPRVAIETAEAWLASQASSQDCLDAAHAAIAAGASAFATSAANFAANAAVHAANANNANNAYAYAAATNAAEAAAYTESRDSHSEPWQQARKQHLQTLHALVCALPWPRTTPTAAQLHAAAPHVQVAWDAVCALSGELTIAQLLAAHEHATALELDWSDPVQRAMAERVQDVAQVSGLLQGAAIDAAGG